MDVFTGRTISDSTGVGDFIDTQDFSISWTNTWMPRLSTNLGLYLTTSNFENNAREDDVTRVNLDVNYKLMKTTMISTGVKLAQRDSTSATDEYDQAIYQISIKSTFK